MKQAVQTPRDPHPEGQRKIIAYDLAINYCALGGEAEAFQGACTHGGLKCLRRNDAAVQSLQARCCFIIQQRSSTSFL